MYEGQWTVESTHDAHLIGVNINTIVWNQIDKELNLSLFRTWAADFLAQIFTRRIGHIVRVKQIISQVHLHWKSSTPYTWPPCTTSWRLPAVSAANLTLLPSKISSAILHCVYIHALCQHWRIRTVVACFKQVDSNVSCSEFLFARGFG